MPLPDPDKIEAGKLRYLASFYQPAASTAAPVDTFGHSTAPPTPVFQAYVSLEAEQGLELVTGDQVQAHVTYMVEMRWSPTALNLRKSWQMTLTWPQLNLPLQGQTPTVRTFELLEPARDPPGRRRKLVFRVVESTKSTGG